MTDKPNIRYTGPRYNMRILTDEQAREAAERELEVLTRTGHTSPMIVTGATEAGDIYTWSDGEPIDPAELAAQTEQEDHLR